MKSKVPDPFSAPSVSSTATAGATATLTDSSRTEESGYFVGYTLTITAGTGAGQSRNVASYNGSTKVFTVAQNFTTAPSTDSQYTLTPNALVTDYAYNASGWLETVTDPRGIVDKTYHDRLGRVTKTVEAYTNGTPTKDSNRTTEWTYNGNGDITSMIATNVDATPTTTTQTTTYTYGVTTGSSYPSSLNSNNLLASVTYPSIGGSINTQEKFKYNALNERSGFTDRNGTTHAYKRDGMGRVIEDEVTTFGSGVSQAIKKLTYGFDSANRPDTFTSWGYSGGSYFVSNEVLREYNSLGQTVREYQSHSGTVNTSTTPVVQYNYTETRSGTSFVNHSRLTDIVYPDGRTVSMGYVNTTASPGDRVSRVSYIEDSGVGGITEEYSYLGIDRVTKRYRPEPRTEMTFYSEDTLATGDGGDFIVGLDRFGRVVDQSWVKRNTSGVITGTLDRFKYGYDKNSNRMYRDNALTDSLGGSGIDGFDELYHANGSSNGYDNLDRLAAFSRGTLNAAKDSLTGTVARSQGWNLDALGNMSGVTTNSSTQTRTHDGQNRMTSVSGQSAPTYDANGNLLDDDTNTYTYDAWNRLASTFADGRTWGYAHDALNRRTIEGSSPGDVYPPPPDTHLYYDTNWRVLQEVSIYTDGPNAGQGTTVANVWSAEYIDGMVLRDTTYNEGGGGGAEFNALIDGLIAENEGGGEEQQSLFDTDPGVARPVPPAGRIYVQQDANFNTTSITDETGTVLERYVYDPYGRSDVLTVAWSYKTGAAAFDGDYAFLQRFQGLRLDLVSADHHARNRDLNGRLSVWNSQDPIGYPDGANRYRSFMNAPVNKADPLGLAPNQEHVGDPDDVIKQIERLEHQGMSNSDIMDTLADYYGAFPKDGRYVYTCQYGWIDLRHFFTAADKSDGAGWGYGVFVLGFYQEVVQWATEWGDDYRSGFSPEDIPSNEAGVNFGDNLEEFPSLSIQMKTWFAFACAKKKNDPENPKDKLPPTDPSVQGPGASSSGGGTLESADEHTNSEGSGGNAQGSSQQPRR